MIGGKMLITAITGTTTTNAITIIIVITLSPRANRALRLLRGKRNILSNIAAVAVSHLLLDSRVAQFYIIYMQLYFGFIHPTYIINIQSKDDVIYSSLSNDKYSIKEKYTLLRYYTLSWLPQQVNQLDKRQDKQQQ